MIAQKAVISLRGAVYSERIYIPRKNAAAQVLITGAAKYMIGLTEPMNGERAQSRIHLLGRGER